jgi:hypothetical protein
MGKWTTIAEAAIEVLAKKPGGALPAATVPPKTLPTDEASRMARAREMGFDVDTPWYHGTTHDIQEFGGGAHNVEGHFGAGHYFTDSPLDASANYAGVGPDLTNRIEQRAERIAGELYDTSDKPQEVLDRFGRMQAKRELKGPNDGAVYPALLRGKTVDVSNYTRGQPTILESSPMPSAAEFYDEASKKLGSTASHEEIYDLAESLADDAFADWVPTGQLADFADGIRESAQQYGFDANEVLESIQDELIEGVASADSLDRSLRNSPLMYAEDPETGALVMNDVIRKAFNRAGFDNIVMDAKSAFPKMPNIPEGTRHIITSKPENIRSRFAQFDPAKKDSADILAGVGGIAAAGGALSAMGGEARAQEPVNPDDLDPELGMSEQFDRNPLARTGFDPRAVRQLPFKMRGYKAWTSYEDSTNPGLKSIAHGFSRPFSSDDTAMILGIEALPSMDEGGAQLLMHESGHRALRMLNDTEPDLAKLVDTLRQPKTDTHGGLDGEEVLMRMLDFFGGNEDRRADTEKFFKQRTGKDIFPVIQENIDTLTQVQAFFQKKLMEQGRNPGSIEFRTPEDIAASPRQNDPAGAALSQQDGFDYGALSNVVEGSNGQRSN